MSRMLLAIWIALAGLVLQVLAQKEFTTHGDAGPSCGKAGTHCLSTARCNRNKMICQCKPPLLGNGKLGCFRPGDAVSFLQLDPNIKTYDGDYLNIPIPCRYKVVHYTMAVENGARANAEVYAKNIVSSNGDYYVSSVLVIISVVTVDTKVGKYSVLLEGFGSEGRYTFETRILEDTMTKSPFMSQLDFTKYTISVSVDKVNNFIIAKAPEVGLRVSFRPPSLPLEGPQRMVPGVTMVIDKDIVKSVKFVNGTLSSSPLGPSIRLQAENMGMDLQQYVYFLAIFNTSAIIMDDKMCQDISVIFNKGCKNEASRATLLQTCSSLYSDRDFVKCIYDKRRIEEIDIGQRHRLLFRYCAQAFCLQRVDFCQVMMQSINTLKCPLPAKMRNFQCSSESLRIP